MRDICDHECRMKVFFFVTLAFSFQIFTANYDRYTVVENMLDKPIVTRYLRIHPESWQSHISMRTEFLGCKKGIYLVLNTNTDIPVMRPTPQTNRFISLMKIYSVLYFCI